MDKFNIHPEVQELFEEMVGLRRQIHMHPEINFDLPITSKLVSDYLTSLNLEVHTEVGQSGVVGVINNPSGPCILLRADMDCLPIEEANDVPYKSKIPGKMHACGHDSHIAMLLTAAKVLSRHRDHLKGSVKFLFQPAEEGGHGAREMINDPKYPVLDTQPLVDQVYGIHISNHGKLGDYLFPDKYVSCYTDFFDITIHGKGGHMSADTNNPITIGAELILQIQTILSRNVSNKDRAVISITSFNAGEANNAVPAVCKIKGTVRTFEGNVRDLIFNRMSTICKGIEIEQNCKVDFKIIELYYPIENNPECNERALKVLKKIAPEASRDSVSPMIGEDFSYLTNRKPGSFFMLSTGRENSIHSPSFDIDERAMMIGASFFVELILDILV